MDKARALKSIEQAGRVLADTPRYRVAYPNEDVELAATVLAASLWEVGRSPDVDSSPPVSERIAALPDDGANFKPEELLNDFERQFLPAARLVVGLTYTAARDNAMQQVFSEMNRV